MMCKSTIKGLVENIPVHKQQVQLVGHHALQQWLVVNLPAASQWVEQR
jgi:hypothetical protein